MSSPSHRSLTVCHMKHGTWMPCSLTLDLGVLVASLHQLVYIIDFKLFITSSTQSTRRSMLLQPHGSASSSRLHPAAMC